MKTATQTDREVGKLLEARPLEFRQHSGFEFAIDAERPNWVATNESGRELLTELRAGQSVGDIVESYRKRTNQPLELAEEAVTRFLGEARDAGLLVGSIPATPAYRGRRGQLTAERLEEFWVQINDFCNLSCAHCLVSSSPQAGRGLPAGEVRSVVDQALDLGARMVAFTGGEPFFREDLFDLWELVLSEPERTVLTLTNGTLIKGKILERIRDFASKRLELRISLDGPDAETNDPIRGNGSFKGAIRGIENAVAAGCQVTVTTSLNGRNHAHIHRMPALLKELGVSQMHVLWPFQRGRALEVVNQDLTPSVAQLTDGYERIKKEASAAGIMFFNYASWKVRIDGAPGFKYDLANHCWSSLCFNTDGQVYPSPALTQHEELALGDATARPLRDIWQNSPRAEKVRNVSVIDRPQCRGCALRFICGGGDMDHAYNTSRANPRATAGDYTADDPYCGLYQRIIDDAMADWTRAAVAQGDFPDDPSPRIFRQMGNRPGRPPAELGIGRLPMGTIPST